MEGIPVMKRLFALLLVLLFMPALCAAEAKESAWQTAADTPVDSELWAAVTAYDDAFDPDITYEPVMLLASDGNIEAWLVRISEEKGKKGLQPTGYLVMYVQREPVTKVLDAVKAGKRLKEAAPACELKFLLDSSLVLDGDHRLTPDILEAFGMDGTYETISAVFVDTPDRDFLDLGWVNRIRVKGDKPKYSLTYKRRFQVGDGGVEQALADAREQGFTLYDAQFPAEIDWGYARMTLSFSADADVKQEEMPDLDRLSLEDARRMLLENMPFEETAPVSGGEAAELMAGARMAGPIHFLRYTGSLNGQEAVIEVWPVPDGEEIRYITEWSAGFDTVEEAAEYREGAMAALEDLGILLHTDSLKTQLILNAMQ